MEVNKYDDALGMMEFGPYISTEKEEIFCVLLYCIHIMHTL